MMAKTIVIQGTIIKFQNEQWVEDTRQGKLFMRKAKKFREFENKAGDKVVGDKDEGRFYTPEASFRARNTKTGEIHEADIDENTILDTIYSNSYVFCMFNAMWNGGMGFSFTEEQKENIRKFGNKALVIINFNEFQRRIIEAAQKAGYKVVINDVNYYPEGISAVPYLINMYLNFEDVVFWKNDSYKYQQECRIALINTDDESEDTFTLDIGDISDISEVVSADEILKGCITKHE